MLPEDAAEVIGVAVPQHFGDGAHAEGGIAQKLQRVRHFEPGDVSGHRCVQVLPKQAHDVLPRQMKRIAEIGKRQRFGVMLVNVVQHAREHRRITARAGLPAAHIQQAEDLRQMQVHAQLAARIHAAAEHVALRQHGPDFLLPARQPARFRQIQHMLPLRYGEHIGKSARTDPFALIRRLNAAHGLLHQKMDERILAALAAVCTVSLAGQHQQPSAAAEHMPVFSHIKDHIAAVHQNQHVHVKARQAVLPAHGLGNLSHHGDARHMAQIGSEHGFSLLFHIVLQRHVPVHFPPACGGL